MAYKDLTPPTGGKISIQNGKLNVPDNPVIPFIRGDGTGPDIWVASVRVFDAAVQRAYGGKRKVAWFEVFAGEAAKNKFDNWLPDDTVEARTVVVRRTWQQWSVIDKGLSPGERVVTDGQLRLAPGARVAVRTGLVPASTAPAEKKS